MRPIGLHLAWAAAGHKYADQTQHMRLARRHEKLNPDVSFEARSRQRAAARASGQLDRVFELERDPRDGEGDEPELHCAY